MQLGLAKRTASAMSSENSGLGSSLEDFVGDTMVWTTST